MSIESKIKPLQDKLTYVNMLVYADSGAGKTVFGGSDDKVLFIAPEDSGLISAKRHGSSADAWQVRSWDDLLEAYEYLYDQIQENGHLDYKWLVIDSLTEMQAMAMTHVLKQAADDKPGKSLEVPEIQDWQRYYIIFEKMIRAFNDLDVNVLYTALSRKVEDAEGEDFYLPDIQGKDYLLALKIVSFMTSYGHMRVEVSKTKDAEGKVRRVRHRRIYWEDTGSSRGKDRTRALAPHTDNLTLRDIREKIEKFGASEDPKKAVRRKPARKAVEQQDHSTAEDAAAAVESRDEETTSDE